MPKTSTPILNSCSRNIRLSIAPDIFLVYLILPLILFIILPYESLANDLILHNTVIKNNTIWNDRVIIDGVVVVSRKATLTISPGTRISFIRRDSNGDGIGDGELRVLGGIKAVGTAQSPIIFDSDEDKPAAKDWSYLMIFTSPAINYISWCEFHHAFTGLQVHFSTLIVDNCKFTQNNEGFRFGRADLTITNSLFSDNDVGIRFTRMEGPVRITGNEISNNRIGLFLVPSGQNIRDFFEPDRSGTPWNTGHLQISGNNIHKNLWYNLDLGEKQIWDLDISNNFWELCNIDKIHLSIFDKRRDDSLGKVLMEPFATTPFVTPYSTTGSILKTP